MPETLILGRRRTRCIRFVLRQACTLPKSEDEQVNACDFTLPLGNWQGARGMMRCSQRPHLADGYLYWLRETSVQEKGTLGFHHPALSLVQVGLNHRSSSRPQEKTRRYKQETTKKGLHRLQERPANDRFSRDAPSWIDLVHQLDFRTPALASGCPMVVMVQPAHDRKCDHLVACMMRGFG